jgi:hypothetical protein
VVAAERTLVALAVVSLVAIDALYVAIIRSQGGPDPVDVLTVPFVAGYMALLAFLLGLSIFLPPAIRPALRAASTAGLLALAVLTVFSIGIGVFIAAMLALAATVMALVERHGPSVLGSAGFAAVLAVAVMVTGLQFSWQHIECPPTGQVGGTTPGFFTGGVSYECDGGRLTFR